MRSIITEANAIAVVHTVASIRCEVAPPPSTTGTAGYTRGHAV